MSRLGGFTSLLALAAGCAVAPQRPPDAAHQQWDDTSGHCRGELLLVDAPPPGNRATPPAVQAAAANPDGKPTGVGARAIEAARKFTVAVRAQRRASRDDRLFDIVTSTQHGDLLGRVLVDGTGVVLDRSGLIVTNHHVVRNAAVVEVWASCGAWLPARVVGTDSQSDLAVIAVDARLPAAARWADAGALRIAQAVVALGYTPGRDLGKGPQALRGRLTGLHRSLQGALDPTQDRYYGDLLQSTVPLEPGHSGGPLIDRTGSVVGINTASVTRRKSGRCSGYAIRASRHIQSVIVALASGRAVSHGYLGVLVCADAAGRRGVPVEQVVPGGPADRAGLRPADVIVRVADSATHTAAQLAEAVRAGPIGKTLRLDVQRGGQRLELPCALRARPSSR
ncbi:MAG: S1C family serine protease [Planctomycetota bacterium]